MKTAIGDFLNKLMEVGQTTGGDRGSSTDLKFDSLFKTTNLDVKSDLCMACRSSVEESCIHFQSHIWHSACFFCVGCQKDLNSREGVSVARYDSVENRVYCEKCAHPSAVKGFEQVTQLQQYTFLLRVALKRLYGLLKAKGKRKRSEVIPMFLGVNHICTILDDRQLSSSRLLVPPVASGTTSTRDSMQSIESREAGPTVESTSRSKSYLALDDMQAEVRKSFGGDLNEESGPLSAKGETTHGFDGPVGARALLQPQDSVHNLIEDTRLATPVTDASVPRIQSAKSLPVPVPTQPANATTDTDHPWPIAPATAASKSPSTAADTTRPFARAHVDGTSTRQPMYLAELSALEYFIVRHLAVIKLHPLVGDVYTHSDLVALVRAPKQSLWSRMMSTLKPGKKQPKQKGMVACFLVG